MQYNHIITLKKIRQSPFISTFIKVLIFLFVTLYIYYSIQNKVDFDRDFKEAIIRVFKNFGFWILIPVLLFPVNWALEALKWKYLTAKIEKVSFMRSFRGIFTGVTLGFVTPFGLGDYAGRILQLKSPERARGFGAVFISRISQFYITLVCGSSSLIFLAYKTKNIDGFFSNSFDVFVFFILVTNSIFILLFLFHKKILLLLKEWKLFKKAYPYVEVIAEYSYNEITYVLLLSFLRYAVFTTQFIIILYCFNVSNNIGILLLGVNFIFLVKSVIPTLFDLGVRESAALYFFSEFTLLTNPIVFASLSIWFVNILIPAIVGMFLIFTLKIFTRP